MNNSNIRSSHADIESLQTRFALRVAARLNEQTASTPADISERLRVAREQAVERAGAARRALAAEPQVVASAGASAILGGGDRGWWLKAAAWLPLVALVGGLALIQHWQTAEQISVAAEVDTALLSDSVPPSAYSDGGFVEFLKAPRD
jgi:hypothetical protein